MILAKNESTDLKIPTPFGQVFLQKPELPELKPPSMNERRNGAMKHAIASDIAGIIGTVPVIGDIIADVVEDLHYSEIRKILTADELDEFSRQDKVSPTSIAMVRTFTKIK